MVVEGQSESTVHRSMWGPLQEGAGPNMVGGYAEIGLQQEGRRGRGNLGAKVCSYVDIIEFINLVHI